MNDIIAAVERNRQLILDTERFIWRHPETGYKEYKTHDYMAMAFESLGYELTYAEGITGFVQCLRRSCWRSHSLQGRRG